MELFVGIDQSINSSGVTIRVMNVNAIDEVELGKHFYIITGKEKLTAREQKAQTTYTEFDYVKYHKEDVKTAKNNHEAEINKTLNLVRIADVVISIINHYLQHYDISHVSICMEGISYQSANTSSIMELAGLNYLIRYKIMKFFSLSEIHYELIVAPPGEIKKFASGNGSAKKEIMVKLFEASHPNLYLIPKIDDIADSYWMCEYAKHLFKKDIQKYNK